MPGRIVAEPAGRGHGAGEEPADRRGDGDAADARRERRRAARRGRSEALRARSRRGMFHASDSTAACSSLHGRAQGIQHQLHESPVSADLAVGGRDHDRAQPRRRPPTARTGRSSVDPPVAAHLRVQPTSTRLIAVHLDGVRRAEQAGPHARLVPGDEERPRAEAPRRVLRRRHESREPSGRSRLSALEREAQAARERARCRRSRSTTPSAGRPWRCWPAASGPSGRAAPRSRPPRR